MINNGIDLEQAMVTAVRAGKDFHIPPGVYPAFYLRNGVAPTPVKVTADPGTVIQGLVSQASSGITFKGIEFLSDPGQRKAVAIQNGSDIHFDGCNIHGAAPGDGGGISFGVCPNSSIVNCELHLLDTAIAVSRSDGFSCIGNSIHDIRNDGMQFNASSHITITGNKGTRFFPQAGDHSDFCQFQTVGQGAGATDIMIADNTFVCGDVPVLTQGIFMGNESQHAYQRVTITRNALLGTIYHGIALSMADASTISDNLVASFAGADIVSWILADETCTNGSVTDNVTTSVNRPPKTTLTWANNQVIAAPAVADVPALLAKWLKRHDAPAPSADPRDATIAGLRAQIAAAKAILSQ
jgi:hypothetical protein